MGQVNRGGSVKLRTNRRAGDGNGREVLLVERKASAERQPDDGSVIMPPPAPKSWPRVFPGL